MLQTTVRPNKEYFEMHVSLPIEYVGKEVRVLFYVDEEVQQTTASILPKRKPSAFFGTLTKQGEKMQEYVKKSHNEKLAQLRKATTDSLFLADIQEIEADFIIADQETV